MKAYDHQYITEYLMDGYEGYEPEEECPHCGEWFDWIVDENDEVVCPHCNALVWFWEPEAPQGVDEEEVPL
jgi:uncharacterized Zn-finger protein